MGLQSRYCLDGGERAVSSQVVERSRFTGWATGKRTAGLLVFLPNECCEGNMSACIFVVAVVSKWDHI